MNFHAKISYSVKSLFLKKKMDAQLSEEVRTHLAMAEEANVAAGMVPEEARYAALREFGNTDQTCPHCCSHRRWPNAGWVQDWPL